MPSRIPSRCPNSHRALRNIAHEIVTTILKRSRAGCQDKWLPSAAGQVLDETKGSLNSAGSPAGREVKGDHQHAIHVYDKTKEAAAKPAWYLFDRLAAGTLVLATRRMI